MLIELRRLKIFELLVLSANGQELIVYYLSDAALEIEPVQLLRGQFYERGAK